MANSPSRREQILEYIRCALELEDRSALLSLHRDEAQIAIDEVWKLLDLGGIVPRDSCWASHKLRQLALKIAIKHSILPSAFLLAGVVCTQTDQQIQGGFADIFCGRFGTMNVAIKRLRVFLRMAEPRRAEFKQAFYLECLLWKGLSHQHILPFLGVAEDIFQNTVCIILPWMDNGRVVDYIEKLRSEGRLRGPEFQTVLNRLLYQVALGLEYLHTEKIVHGDLHGANILVDADGSVKLTDFGMSVAAEGTPYNYGSTHGGGAVRWTAPELMEAEEFGLQTHRPTYQSDIYSFACVCVELYSRQPPFPELQRDYQIISRVMRGGRSQRPVLPDGDAISENLWSLITSCWAHQPSERPSITSAVRTLTQITHTSFPIAVPSIRPHPDRMVIDEDLQVSIPTHVVTRIPGENRAGESSRGFTPPFEVLKSPKRIQFGPSESLPLIPAEIRPHRGTNEPSVPSHRPLYPQDGNSSEPSSTSGSPRTKLPDFKKSFKDEIRVHSGAVDNETITNGDPPEIMRLVRDALDSMGVEIHAETGYRYQCKRPRRGTTVARKTGEPSAAITADLSNLHGDSRRSRFASASGKLWTLIHKPPSESDIPSSASSQGSATPAYVIPLYGESYQDQGDEVRFSVEMTRIERLEATYSLDIIRLRGNLGSFKFLHDTLKDQVVYTDAFMDKNHFPGR